MALRLAFMGSPDFSVGVLNALVEAGHDVACVYAQPPRPAGRGQKERPGPVHARALDLGLEVRTPKRLKDPADQEAFRALNLDIAVVVAYGLILPQAILDAPKMGCLNIHASLLPRWRGAAPIQRAIEAGDKETGVTIMQMDAGLDTGDMLLTETLPIPSDMTGGSLHDELSVLGAKMIVEALAQAEAGTLSSVSQPSDGVAYAHKLDKAESRIDWTEPAEEIVRKIRAFSPWPGTWFERGSDRIKVQAAELERASGQPGVVLDEALLVACGEGAIRITRAQRPGKGPMAAADLLRGYLIEKGEILS